MSEYINIPDSAISAALLRQVVAQRDKAMTDLASAQAAIEQMAARIRELEADTTRKAADASA